MHSAMSVIEQAVGLTRWETEKCGIWDQLAERSGVTGS